MASQQGQTDQILKVKLASQVVLARWLDTAVAANGEAGLEVATVFVGHGAPIKILIKDSEGGTAGSLEGQVLQNAFRARFKPGPKAAGKTLTFEAELPKHGLKRVSGPLRVAPPVKVTDLAWMDPGTEKTADVHYQGDDLDFKAKVDLGPKDGQAVVKVEKVEDGHSPVQIATLDAAYAEKAVRITWKPRQVDYHKPGKLRFRIELAGTASEASSEIAYKQNPTELKSEFAWKQSKALAEKLDQQAFIAWCMVVFGNDLSAPKVDAFRQDLKSGAIKNPPIVLLPRRAMSGGDGKYDKLKREIAVSEEVLAKAARGQDTAKLALILLEEFGHYLDDQLRTKYGAGDAGKGDATNLDEGEAFSYALVLMGLGEAGKIEYATCKVKGAERKLEIDVAGLQAAVAEAISSPDALDDVTQGQDEFFGSGPGKDMPVPPYHSYTHQHILWDAAAALPPEWKPSQKQLLQIYFGNWVRDYSQIVDPKAMMYTGFSRKTLTDIVNVLAEFAFTEPLNDVAATRAGDFQLSKELVGVYRPEEHIDNPNGITDEKAVDKDFRGACTKAELAVDCDLMMKKYIRTPGAWDTSAAYLKAQLEKAVDLGLNAKGCLRLGFALHVLEDFFSHSNFAELALRKAGYAKVYPWVTDNGGCQSGPKEGAQIAVEHEVRTGDSLESLAKAHGISWQDITRFNWNTAVPTEVNRHLYMEVGCRKPKADDAPFDAYANYAFSSNDKKFGTGRIKIPKKRTGEALPLVTGSFGGADTAASLLLMLGKMLSKEELFDPGKITASQKILYVLLRDKYPAYASEYVKLLKDWKKFKEENPTAWLILYNTLGVITRGLKFGLGTGILAIGTSIDDAQSAAAQEGTDPTHTQVGKDHANHHFHSLAAKLAVEATRAVVLETLKAWAGESTKEKVVKTALDFLQNPLFTTWEEKLVKSWASGRPANVKRGEQRIVHSHELEEARKTAEQWTQVPGKVKELLDLIGGKK